MEALAGRTTSYPNTIEEERLMATQENHRAPGYQERQEEIELNGEMVWADPKLIPLLKALNEAGLITRSHCEGHESDEAFVVIRMDNITGIETCTRGEYNEVRLHWHRKA